jgi:iron complex transport system substrate-binding protein
MHRPTMLAACGTLAIVVLAGCGSSTTTPAATSAPAATISKADYITQADAICTAGTAQVTAIGAAPGDPTTVTADQLPAWNTYLGKVDTILSIEAPKLAALPNPDQGQAQSDAILGDLAKVITDGQAAEAAATAGDVNTFKAALVTYATDASAANTAATAYGLTACGASK